MQCKHTCIDFLLRFAHVHVRWYGTKYLPVHAVSELKVMASVQCTREGFYVGALWHLSTVLEKDTGITLALNGICVMYQRKSFCWHFMAFV